MSLRSSICDYIESKSAITSLIGTRFYPQVAKGGVSLPYAVYRRSSQIRYPASSGSTAIVTTSLRIVSFADTYDEAESVSDQFRIALDGKRGTVGDQYFSSCQLVGESDDIDPIEFAQSSAPHFVAQEFSITHRESAPTL